jgi:hypothetical protein
LPKDEAKWTDEDLESYKIIKCHNWMDEECLNIGNKIQRIYKQDAELNLHHWMCFFIDIGEDIKEHNTGPKDFVLIDTGFVLYEKNQRYEYGKGELYLEEKFGSSVDCPQESNSSHPPARTNKIESEKKLRPGQKDKLEVQRIGRRVWQEYGILDIVHLKKHPDIKMIAGGKYGMYKETTIHRWLSEIAPENAKKQGKRSKRIRDQQQKICKEIGIKM